VIALLAALLAVPAFAFMTTPLRQPDLSAWGFVADLGELPADGQPKLLRVRFPKRDAWTRHADNIAASVFVRLVPDRRQVLALYLHLHSGWRVCDVKYDEKTRVFNSRCWGVRFDLEGKEIASEGSHRTGDCMERLPVRLIGSEVYVNLDRQPRE